MKTYKFLFLLTFICILSNIIHSENIETLQSFIHDVLVDEIYRNATIDTLDKYKLQNALWDSLQNVTSGTDAYFKEGRLIELEIDLKFLDDESADFLNNTSVEVTIQLIYDTSEAILNDKTPFTREMPIILLSTTQNRLISSFVFNFVAEISDFSPETDISDFSTNGTNDLSGNNMSQMNRPGIYLVFLNGVYQEYTYNELEERAFSNKRLTNVSIPQGIEIIGVRSFANNRLTSINIPHSVKLIKSNAFERNRIDTVSIGENVQLERNAIGRNFESFYRLNGSKAGVYVFNSNSNMWVFRP